MTEYVGSGRVREGGLLVTSKKDFNAHINGETYKHNADVLNMNPPLGVPFDGYSIQDTITKISQYLNNQFITVGDGINTFGVYNGTDGIDQAIAYCKANNIFSAKIKIAAGDYIWNETILDGSNFEFTGEGTGYTTITVSNTFSSLYSHLKFSNIFIQANGFPTVSNDIITVQSNNYIEFNECNIYGTIDIKSISSTVRINGGSHGAPNFGYFITAKGDGIGTETAYVEINNAIITVVVSGGGLLQLYGRRFGSDTTGLYSIILNSCNINSATTIAIASLDVTYPTTYGNFICRDLKFKDCIFTNCGMNLISGISDTNQIKFENIEFDGCKFSTTDNLSFLISCYNFVPESTQNGIEQLVIKNCTWSSSYYTGAPISYGVFPSNNVWGGRFAVSSERLYIDKLFISGTVTKASNIGDIFLAANQYNIKNINVDYSATSAGAGSLPQSRFSITPGRATVYGASSIISGITLYNLPSGLSSNGIVFIHDRVSGNGDIIIENSMIEPADVSAIYTYSSSSIMEITIRSSNFQLPTGAYCISAVVASGDILSNLIVDNCKFKKPLLSSGGIGIQVSKEVSSLTDVIQNVRISNCFYSGNDQLCFISYVGMPSTNLRPGIFILNNQVYTDDTNAITYEDDGYCVGTITGNICKHLSTYNNSIIYLYSSLGLYDVVGAQEVGSGTVERLLGTSGGAKVSYSNVANINRF